MTEYRPGACDIGREERRKRRAVAALGFLVTAVYAAWAQTTASPRGV